MINDETVKIISKSLLTATTSDHESKVMTKPLAL